MSSGSHLSREFFELVKSIGESKSKQEEDRIVQREVLTLKKLFSSSGASSSSSRRSSSSSKTPRKMREMLVRLLYVEMLGHDASFGYIHAVQMTAGANLLHKKTAYLVSGQTLHPGHELRFMMVNQLQRDLQSPNHLQVCVGLIALTNIGTKDMIPALMPSVVAALSHKQAIVRKKAVMAMHHFWRMDSESVSGHTDHFQRILCDTDPAVMAAGLHILMALAKDKPQDHKALVPSFVSILKQITEHRLSRDYDYHRMPAPWIQIKLLQILGVLGAADQAASEGMYEVVHEVMRRADTGINVGYAIMYECIRTVTKIYPNATLLDAAADSIARFIQSENHNLRYLGVTGLASVVEDHPRYAAQHQMAVMDCLENPDETLKRKTLQLLYRMTNPVNVEVIVDKLLGFLKGSTDVFLRRQLVSQIAQLAERFAPSNQWFITTLTSVFEIAGDLVKPKVAHTVMRLVAEGSGEDDEADEDLRRDVVEDYLELLRSTPVETLPDTLAQVICWILGEYAYLQGPEVIAEVCERICELAKHTREGLGGGGHGGSGGDAAAAAEVSAVTTQTYAVTAVIKLTAQYGQATTSATALVLKYANSSNSDLQQRCYEFMELSKMPHLMREVLPVDASYEDLEVDDGLGFLDSYVQDARNRGLPDYSPPEEEDESVTGQGGGGSMGFGNSSDNSANLRFDAYAKPTVGSAAIVNGGMISGGVTEAAEGGGEGGPEAAGAGGAAGSGGDDNLFGGLKVTKNVWGSNGFTGKAAGMDAGASSGGTGMMGAVGMGSGFPASSGGASQGNTAIEASIVPGSGGASASGSGTGLGSRSGMESTREPEPEPEPEPEISQREKEAMALFGGIAGSGGAGSGRTTQSRGRAGRARRNRAGRSGQSRSAGSTSDGGSSAPPATVAAAAGGGAEGGGSDDLLDLLGGEGGGNSGADATTAGSGDMFSGLNTGAAGAQAGAGNTGSSGGGNLFGMGDLMGSGGVESTVSRGLQLSPAGLGSTAEFGQLWGSHTAETAGHAASANVQSPEDFMQLLSARCNLQGVQAIAATSEAICAGRDQATGNVVLVHGQIVSGGVNLKALNKRCIWFPFGSHLAGLVSVAVPSTVSNPASGPQWN